MSRLRAHIVGVGETQYTRWGKIGDVTEHALACQAISRAVADAGLSMDDVDGMASFAEDRNEAIFLAAELGLPGLRFANMVWMPGGGGGCAAISNAAMAVESGQAEVVVVYRSLCQGQFFRFGNPVPAKDAPAEPSGPTLQQANSLFLASMGFAMPYGLLMAAAAYALPTRRHMHLYGTTSEQLGAVAVAMRRHASLNDNALYRKPIAIEDHQSSPLLVEPFHLFDCCIESDGGASIIVSSAVRARERERETGRPVVLISGVAEGHPDSPSSIATRGEILPLGVAKAAPRAFAMAGMTPGDIDVAELYDCFTYICLKQIEDIGFCKEGEGGAFVEDGGIELGGRLPVNTHGGLLSQAHTSGMNHVVEAVRQLRGECGPRQVADCTTALVSNFGDLGDGSVAILRGEPA